MSNEHLETLREFDAHIVSMVEDFADSEQDRSDYCCECADGSQWAIYYGRAWDLVEAVRARRTSDLASAEFDYDDVFTDSCDTDTRMTRLAYLITHAALWQALEDKAANAA
jgi:hypothetical protein